MNNSKEHESAWDNAAAQMHMPKLSGRQHFKGVSNNDTPYLVVKTAPFYKTPNYFRVGDIIWGTKQGRFHSDKHHAPRLDMRYVVPYKGAVPQAKEQKEIQKQNSFPQGQKIPSARYFTVISNSYREPSGRIMNGQKELVVDGLTTDGKWFKVVDGKQMSFDGSAVSYNPTVGMNAGKFTWVKDFKISPDQTLAKSYHAASGDSYDNATGTADHLVLVPNNNAPAWAKAYNWFIGEPSKKHGGHYHLLGGQLKGTKRYELLKAESGFVAMNEMDANYAAEHAKWANWILHRFKNSDGGSYDNATGAFDDKGELKVPMIVKVLPFLGAVAGLVLAHQMIKSKGQKSGFGIYFAYFCVGSAVASVPAFAYTIHSFKKGIKGEVKDKLEGK